MSDQGSLVAPRGSSLSVDIDAVREPDPFKGGDVYKWAMDQVALINAGRYNEVDWVNVADEIESVGKSEFRSLSSHLEVVLVHMLKWDHQTARRSRSWVNSIKEHRIRVGRDLSQNPSLKPRTEEAIQEAYELARVVASRETDLPIETFPEPCLYDWDAIMTRPFVLDPTINVADEIESVGKSEQSALTSELTVVIQHMLKWDYQPQRRSRSWELSIREHRRRARRRLGQNPGLGPKLDAVIADAYEDGRDRALAEPGLRDADIPAACAYSPSDLFDRPFVHGEA